MNGMSLLTAHIAALIAALGLAGASPARAADGAASLTVKVSGLHSAKGRLIACLWRDKAKFPICEKSTSALRRDAPVTGARMAVRFENVPPGNYAVTVVHDEDGNGRLKRNFLGMPLEGVGVSNNPGGMPRFRKSLVAVSGTRTISVQMRYLFD